jgi:hypothetical protein
MFALTGMYWRWWRRLLLVLCLCEIVLTAAISAAVGGWQPMLVAVVALLVPALSTDGSDDAFVRTAVTSVATVFNATRMIVYSLDVHGHELPVFGTLRMAVALASAFVHANLVVALWFEFGRRHGGSLDADTAMPVRASKSE